MDEAERKATLEAIADCGVVGAGGAGFPTAAKLEARVDTVIANGAECEPLLGCDQAAMEARLDELLAGMKTALDLTGAERGFIAVKAKHGGLCERIEAALAAAASGHGGEAGRSEPRVSLFRLGNFYPAGDEVILIEAVTGRVVPEGGLPKDVGVLVQNVTTLINLAAARRGLPVTERLVTVAGEVARPMTMSLPIGTPLSFLLEAAGGPTVDDYVLVLGGPMMGKVCRDLSIPVTKTLGGLLVLPADHRVARTKLADPARAAARARSACCQCNFCTELCPRYLVGHGMRPHIMMRGLASAGAPGGTAILPSTMAYLCSECGLCGMYACAQGLAPFSVNSEAKRLLREAKVAPDRRGRPERARASLPDRRTPTDRLMARIDVARYAAPRLADGGEGHFPVDLALRRPPRLVIPLKQHVGAPCDPLVSPGDRVAAGQRIGRRKADALGADIHAPLAGRVAAVGDSIEIAVDGPVDGQGVTP